MESSFSSNGGFAVITRSVMSGFVSRSSLIFPSISFLPPLLSCQFSTAFLFILCFNCSAREMVSWVTESGVLSFLSSSISPRWSTRAFAVPPSKSSSGSILSRSVRTSLTCFSVPSMFSDPEMDLPDSMTSWFLINSFELTVDSWILF